MADLRATVARTVASVSRAESAIRALFVAYDGAGAGHRPTPEETSRNAAARMIMRTFNARSSCTSGR
jgi:hypothetical protein